MLAAQQTTAHLNSYNFALGDNHEPLNSELISTDNSAVSSLKQCSPSPYISHFTYNVRVINASAAVSENVDHINSVSFIKIDVEGYEVNVLKGLETFFNAVYELPLLAIEMLDVKQNHDIVRILLGHGYMFFYSYKKNRITNILGLRPKIFEVNPDILIHRRSQLVFCSAYPLKF
jgi:FkbM family methyltransferase